MASISLESLVLRGVSVLRDGQNVDLRRGTSVAAVVQPLEVVISMRHPSPGCRQAFEPAGGPDHAVDTDMAEACGAGRSRSSGGVLRRRSPARFAGGTVPFGWSPICGGPIPAVALCLTQAKQSAAVDVTSGRLTTANRDLPGNGNYPNACVSVKRSTVGLAWQTPASRTLPAST
jgi:hypothetical protein